MVVRNFTKEVRNYWQRLLLVGFMFSFALIKLHAQSGYALNLASASSQYVSVNNSATLNAGTGAFTIEAWINYSSSVADSTGLVAKGSISAVYWRGYQLLLIGNKLAARISDSSGTTVTAQATTTLSDGKWHHVALVRSGTNIRLYVDSVQEATTTNAIIGNNITNVNSFYIGARRNASGFFNGRIDDIRVWAAARTQSQLQASRFNSISASSTGLSAYYNCDAGSGTSLADATSSANNGTLINSVTWVVSTASIASADPGNCLNFDGTNDYVTIPNATNLGLTTDYTIEAWIRPTNFAPYAGIVSKYQNPGPNNYTLRLAGTSPYTGINFDGYETATGLLVANTWYHIAAVKSGTTRYIYINGNLVSTFTSTGSTTASADALTIGVDYLTSPRYFTGSIDEVRLWNAARSQSQIQATMAVTINPATSNLVAYYRMDAAIAGGTNTSANKLADLTNNRNDGTLTNFSLSSTSSNWLESYAIVVPTATAASNISTNQFTANWSAPATGTVTNYVLDVSSSSNFSTYSSFTVSGTSTTIAGFTAGTTYYYRVRASKTSVANQGTYSSTITTTTLTNNTLNNAGLTSTYVSPAAFSLRKLSSSYYGSAIQVVRSSDNSLADIGFTASGDLDTSALKAFVGNSSGYVKIWYDQSGYARNAGLVSSSLPQIVNSGVINRKNGVPTVNFSLERLATASYTGYSTGYSLAICAGVNTNTPYPDFGGKTNGNLPAPWNIWGNQYYVGNGSSYTYINLTNPVNATSGFSQWTFTGNTSSINAYRNGSNNGSGTTTYYGDAGAPLVLGSRNDGATQLVGWISEYITLNSVLSASDRQTLEANQNAYYFSNNASLSGLTVSSGTLSPTFSSGTTSYSANVTSATNSITVTPTVSSAYASITVRVNAGSYTTVNSGSPSGSLNLNNGTNTIEIVVTAQNGTTTSTYTLTVYRANTLDNVSLTSTYTSPAAFSLRKLSSNYTGYAIQVRRSSDDVTSNIGFTASGDLDTTALKTFVGNNNGFVSIWYDQSGFLQDASQANASLQPQIVNGGIIYRKNGAPTINFNLHSLSTTSYTGYVSAYSLAICAGVAGVTAYPDFGSKTNANGGIAAPWNIWGGQSYLGNGSSFTFISLTNPLNVTSGFSQWTFTGSTSSYNAYRNGNNNGSGTTTYYGDAGAPLVIGSRNDGATQLSGWISEYITLNTVLTINDQQTLESNQNSYYFSSNANLSNLTISSGTLNPSFSSGTTSYAVSVAGSTSSITLTPTVSNASASIQISINGGSFVSMLNNITSSSLSLNAGLNTITVLVTAQDGTTTKSYTIAVTRTLNSWMGGTSTDFSNPLNWSGGTVPTVADDIIINSSSNNPQITGTHLVKNVTINSGASLTVTGTLKIAGSISNNGIITATSGTVEFNGGSAQTIPANAFTSNTVQNLIINNSAGVTLDGTLTVTGVLTPTLGTLNTGGNLILASTAMGTASIATGSGTYITGDVTAQRYTRAQRGYRTFGHPFSSAQNLGILTDNFRITGLTTNAGSGIYATSAGNPSAFLYDPTQTAGSTSVLTRLTDATANVWGVAKGLYVFVRGAGNEGASGTGASNYSSGHSPLTIDGTGAINQGDVTVNLIYGGVGKDNFNLVGNPYPCPINLKTVTNIGSYGTVYVYNPVKNLAGSDQYNLSGGFDQYTNDGSTDIIVPVFGAFYIQATGSGQSLTFKESDKAVGSAPSFAVFGTGTNPKLRLQVANANGVIDELKLGINSSSSDVSTDKYDAVKLGNSLFNFYSLSSDRKALAIDYRANLNSIIPLGIQTNLANNYTISLSELTDMPNTQLVLRDKLLKTETVLSQVGDSYSFSISADTATKGENRFEIGLLGTTVLPVQIADITAQLQTNKTVAVNWTSTSEVNLSSYKVQRSKDGSTFSTVGTVAAKGASSYSYNDDLSTAGVLPSTIYYRLEAIDKDGSKKYSKVVAVALGSNLAKAAINIYPNPVQATLYAQVTVTKAGAAQLRVVDAQGKVVATQKTQLAIGTTSVSIPAAQLTAGSYILEIESADGKQTQRFLKE